MKARPSTLLAIELARIAHKLGLRAEVVTLLARVRPEGLDETLTLQMAKVEFGLA